ncbi:UDP-glycosyltransferase UGT5-like isoform X4 [Daktulosphaira vitifoliae]|uniref:UDP-glycosyltransferase UGT5-like isoform X4 n=1 Tax=Daktulosphaira vitifoliae TaxID=58002 RepID=UPI0021AA7290|nr:UDP-glycosyltransferase UGT5-like isoform X4 [Daktulosphaira vitifoliae]
MYSFYYLQYFFVWFILNIKCSFTANILGVFPIEARSHQRIYDVFMTELHRRGHNVTVYTHFPDIINVSYSRIPIADTFFLDKNYLTIDNMFSSSIFDSYRHMFGLVAYGENYTNSFFMRELYAQSEDTYNLIVTETCNTDLYLALINKFKAPFIAWSTSPMFVWSAERMGVSTHPAYIPVLMSAYGTKMDFFERLASKRYELSLSLSEIILQTTLLFVNTHFTVWGSRPLPQGVIDVGGLHITSSKPLMEDIRKFIDEAEHGIIYFCMGSLLRGETFPAHKRQMFLNVFSKLKQKVLWKWEGDMPGITSNVMIKKWMPQRDILAHPNVKLFISHGGLLGTTEAVYEGVPILAMPIFGDQMTNIKAVMDTGGAEMLNYNNLEEDEIFNKIKAMLTNPIYKNKANKLSEIFRDRPMSPLESAVYWTEYVIKHKGAPHLRTAAVGMPWFQYYLIDVFLVIIIIIVTLCFVIYFTLSKLQNLLKSSIK